MGKNDVMRETTLSADADGFVHSIRELKFLACKLASWDLDATTSI
jgi:hypothetical protein